VTQKVNTMGISAGVRNDVWNAALRVGLAGESKSDDAGKGSPDLKEKGLYNLEGGYWFDSIYAYANVLTAKGTLSTAAGDTDIKTTTYEIGMVNNHKIDGGTFFYGISYLNASTKQEPAGAASKEISESALPLLLGMEYDATSWLTLRASVKQSVFLNDSKNEIAAGADNQKTSMINDTVVAAGAGVKLGKLAIDSTISAATNGRFLATENATPTNTELLANMSMTYMF
ncbi:MAG TPA: hypothetical protein VN132_04525, partial [Bdellovibrio sp.]|nr:hypothetical protein [Bdellovibrio sp.]